jgi:site-specific DNA recombinase
VSKRYCLLLRESTEKNAEAACESQRYALEKEVAARGGHVVAVVADLGYSGALLDRPGIEQVLDLAERRQMDCVLATELGRFSRAESAGFYVLRAELGRCGVRLEFLDGGTWSDDEAAPLLEAISVSLPRMERQRIARRFKRGKEHWWSRGFHWSPTPPYGYDYHGGGHDRGHYTIREDEARWVRAMYEKAGQGWTLAQIGRWLEAQGAKTRRGGAWWPKTVGSILDNPINCGTLASRRVAVAAVRPYVPLRQRTQTGTMGKTGTGRRQLRTSHRLLPAGSWRGPTLRPELAIVDQATFDRAQAARKQNTKTSPRRTREPGLLHGLVFCGLHEDRPHRMYYAAREGRPATWRCSYRAAPGGPYCTSYVHAAPLEAAVWARLLALATEPDAVLADMARRLAQHSAQAGKAARRVSAAKSQVQAAEDLLDRLALAFYGGELARDRYERLCATAEGQKKEALAALAAAEEEAARWSGQGLPPLPVDKAGLVAGHVAEALGYAELARDLVRAALGDPTREALEALAPEEKRRRVKALVEQIIVEGQEVSLVLVLGGTRLPLDGSNKHSGCHAPSASAPQSRRSRRGRVRRTRLRRSVVAWCCQHSGRMINGGSCRLPCRAA